MEKEKEIFLLSILLLVGLVTSITLIVIICYVTLNDNIFNLLFILDILLIIILGAFILSYKKVVINRELDIKLEKLAIKEDSINLLKDSIDIIEERIEFSKELADEYYKNAKLVYKQLNLSK